MGFTTPLVEIETLRVGTFLKVWTWTDLPCRPGHPGSSLGSSSWAFAPFNWSGRRMCGSKAHSTLKDLAVMSFLPFCSWCCQKAVSFIRIFMTLKSVVLHCTVFLFFVFLCEGLKCVSTWGMAGRMQEGYDDPEIRGLLALEHGHCIRYCITSLTSFIVTI